MWNNSNRAGGLNGGARLAERCASQPHPDGCHPKCCSESTTNYFTIDNSFEKTPSVTSPSFGSTGVLYNRVGPLPAQRLIPTRGPIYYAVTHLFTPNTCIKTLAVDPQYQILGDNTCTPYTSRVPESSRVTDSTKDPDTSRVPDTSWVIDDESVSHTNQGLMLPSGSALVKS